MSHLFISYAHADKLFAHRLSEDLLDKGYPVWIDNISLVGGMKWEDEIEANVIDCACVLVVVSPNAATSTWVAKEIATAQQHNKPLIPLIRSGQIADMPNDLHHHQGYDFTGDYTEALQKLWGNPHFPAPARKQFNLIDVLRDGTMTFSSLEKQWRSTIAFGQRPDSPVGLLIERSGFGSTAYLVGRRNATMKLPGYVQIFLQFSGNVEDSAFDQYLAFVAQQDWTLWTILVRGPIEDGRYTLPDNDSTVWEDAIRLTWKAVDKGIYTAGQAAFFLFGPNALALGIGAAKHFKVPIDIYNLNRNKPTDETRYLRVSSLIPPH